MKKIIGIISLLTVITLGQAQICIDSTHHFIAEGYAGVLTGPVLSTDSGKITGVITLRIGGNVYWNPKPYFSLFGMGSAEVNQISAVTPLYLVGTQWNFNDRVSLIVGKIGSPMTELRALPNTGAGQFEPWTKSHILGSAFGGKIRGTITPTISLVAGGFLRGKDDASIEIGAMVPHFQMAAYYQIQAKVFGAAGTLTVPYVTETLEYNYRQELGSLTLVSIPKTAGCTLYSDIGFSSTSWHRIRGEWGVLKNFKIRVVKGLFGIGYAQDSHTVRGYFQVNL